MSESRLHFWQQVPAHESVERQIEAQAVFWRRKSRAYVSVQEGRGVLISNLRVWENLALPAWYHHDEGPGQLEPALRELLLPLGWDNERLHGFLESLPQVLSAADRRVAQLLRCLLAEPALVLADADWWRQLAQKGDLATLFECHARSLPVLIVAHHDVPAGCQSYQEALLHDVLRLPGTATGNG